MIYEYLLNKITGYIYYYSFTLVIDKSIEVSKKYILDQFYRK